MAHNLFMFKYPLKHNPNPKMKYIKLMYEYLYGTRMSSHLEDEIEIMLNEFISIMIVSGVVVLVVYLLHLS